MSALTDRSKNRRMAVGVAAALVMLLGVGPWLFFFNGPRKPPSIFDSPVDDVSSFLADDGFNRLTVDERMQYVADLIKRFSSMEQGDSVIASAFFAGLTGPAAEKLMNNVRTLGKDILIEGAAGYFAIADDAERAAYLDQWVLRWVRFGEMVSGRKGPADETALDDISRDARRDAERMPAVGADMAQQAMDFWMRDVATVASPAEQGQIAQFLPALRDHLVRRGTGGGG